MRVLLLVAVLLAASAPSAQSRSPGKGTPRLVFAATVAYVEGNPQTQIYSVEPSGRRAAQLTFGAKAASAPLSSPDGRGIVFERGGSLWAMRPNGSGQHVLVEDASQPAWTPDSRRIAYVAGDGIHVIGIGGTGDRVLVSGRAKSPAWSPDGKSLAFARDGSLVVLRDGVEHPLVPDQFPEWIAWSHNGRWLAFLDGPHVKVVTADGRRSRELGGFAVTAPAWSPTRPLLGWVDSTFPRSAHFLLLDLATGRIRTLARAPSFVNSLAWSPSGASLAFASGALQGEIPTADSDLGVITLAGHLRYIDRGVSYPLPEAVAWTTPPAGLRYLPPIPVAPLVSKDELKLREPVDDLVADGDRVAYRICGTIGVWRPAEDKVAQVQVDRPLCGEIAIRFYNLALAGDRIAWGILEGGNTQFNSLVVETVGDDATRVEVASGSHTTGDPRGDERAGYLLGAGPLLTFSIWAYCDEVAPVTCPGLPYGQGTTIASQALWRVREPSWPGACPGPGSGLGLPGHCQQLRMEQGPLRTLDVDEGRIVASGNNATLVFDADGRQLLSIPVPTRAAELAGSDLIVVVPGELRDYDVATGALLHAWSMPYVSFSGFCGVPDCGYTQFRLEDAARGLVAYIAGGPRPVGGAVGGEIHLLRLADGRNVVLGGGTAVRFGSGGLVYAYQATGTWPGRIRFVPFDKLPFR